jgi:hypothetical protein
VQHHDPHYAAVSKNTNLTEGYNMYLRTYASAAVAAANATAKSILPLGHVVYFAEGMFLKSRV